MTTRAFAGPKRRRRFSPGVYREILVRQAWRCACCDEVLGMPGTYHFDHVLPLSLGGTDTEDKLQALIKGHHNDKTTRECKDRAKTARIIAQRGLRDKKMSKRDKVMNKILRVMTCF